MVTHSFNMMVCSKALLFNQTIGDVFTMFFNTGFPFSQVYRGHQRQARSRESEREVCGFLSHYSLLLFFAYSDVWNIKCTNLIKASKIIHKGDLSG